MKIIDLHNPERVNRDPDYIEVLLVSSSFFYEEFTVNRVELRLYFETKDDVLGPYSLITSYVDTDSGSIEMLYDEGFRGNDPLKSTTKFLRSHLGISGIVLRSIITLRNQVAT